MVKRGSSRSGKGDKSLDTLISNTSNQKNNQGNNEINRYELRDTPKEERGGHGVRNFFLTLLTLGGLYLGWGAVMYGICTFNPKSKKFDSRARVSEYYRKNIGLLKWPMYFTSKVEDEIASLYAKHYSSTSYTSNPEVKNKINRIEDMLQSGEISENEAEEMAAEVISQYSGGAISKEKAKRIMDIVQQEDNPEEAARKIVDEVPTGLPKPIDRAVKKTAEEISKQLFNRFYKGK